jgi:hypothetical protein
VIFEVKEIDKMNTITKVEETILTNKDAESAEIKTKLENIYMLCVSEYGPKDLFTMHNDLMSCVKKLNFSMFYNDKGRILNEGMKMLHSMMVIEEMDDHENDELNKLCDIIRTIFKYLSTILQSYYFSDRNNLGYICEKAHFMTKRFIELEDFIQEHGGNF